MGGDGRLRGVGVRLRNDDRDDQFADAVALNAALRIYAREDVDSIDEGLDAAREAIADGSAAAVLEDLQAF